MKYAMIIIESDEREAPNDTQREFDSLVRWWADLRSRGKIIASAKLASPRTASTVSWDGQVPIVTDGPYVEAKESVGGFALLDVDTKAEAMEIAGAWPARAGFRIEVRPVEEVPPVGAP